MEFILFVFCCCCRCRCFFPRIGQRLIFLISKQQRQKMRRIETIYVHEIIRHNTTHRRLKRPPTKREGKNIKNNYRHVSNRAREYDCLNISYRESRYHAILLMRKKFILLLHAIFFWCFHYFDTKYNTNTSRDRKIFVSLSLSHSFFSIISMATRLPEFKWVKQKWLDCWMLMASKIAVFLRNWKKKIVKKNSASWLQLQSEFVCVTFLLLLQNSNMI